MKSSIIAVFASVIAMTAALPQINGTPPPTTPSVVECNVESVGLPCTNVQIGAGVGKCIVIKNIGICVGSDCLSVST